MPPIDTTALKEARATMERIMEELGPEVLYTPIEEQVKRQPGILDDPVWWLELALERVEQGYDPFDDQAGYLSVLRKLRDDAWDCQTGRIDAIYKDYQADYQAEAGER